MRHSTQQLANTFVFALGSLISLAAVQIALAAPEDSDAAAVSTDAVATPSSTAQALTGPQVYRAVCIACHAPPGVGGAPAFGDAAAWAPRIAQGMDTLVDHALHGFTGKAGVMPKKGERTDLSDEEIIGAVTYMVEQVAK